MPNVNPVPEIRYAGALRDATVGEPVFPAGKSQDGRSCVKDYEREKAIRWLIAELDKGRNSGGKKTLEEVEKEFGIVYEDE